MCHTNTRAINRLLMANGGDLIETDGVLRPYMDTQMVLAGNHQKFYLQESVGKPAAQQNFLVPRAGSGDMEKKCKPTLRQDFLVLRAGSGDMNKRVSSNIQFISFPVTLE